MNQKTGQAPSAGKPSIAGRVWTFLRIMNVRLRFIFLMVIVGVVAGNWDDIMNYYDRWRRPARAPAAVQAQETEYYCPMHPNIIRVEPGSCPICGMPLSERAKSGGQALPEGVLAQVQLTPLKVQMGRVATTPVSYRLLSREIRTVGTVDYDETRRAFVSSRIKGRLDKLMVNYVGQRVEKGDPLVSIYSPELLVAQEELLTTVRTREPEQAAGEVAAATAQSLVEAASRKLLLWGITQAQVDEIIRRGTPETHLTIYSPIAGIVTEKKVLEGHYVNEGDHLYTIADLSQVWMQAKVFEDEIQGVQIGTAVEVTGTAYPNEVFAGRIAFVAFTVEPNTRTVSARVEIANPDYKLRPGMYARATIRLPLGQVTEIAPTRTRGLADPGADTATLARAYLALAGAYAKDQTDADALAELMRQAQTLRTQGAEAIRPLASALAEQAAQLQGKDLKEQRGLFKALSEQVIDLVRARPPDGLPLFTVHCPMAGADWLAAAAEVANPYYGSAMLRCGSVTGSIEPQTVQSEERFAAGYYCPIYPDRLFAEPQQCPLDKFPTKYVRVEKVLAVPESAVINTGTRKVVYRESAPGTFEMVEVQVGPRAGEFYPLSSGLEAGDRVATAGAFLVDAENRLNPAASAQYFGASGGP
ncbi:MAG: efflux RND transporter periplasmic adaptor subunit [Planctomycetota bacterium]